MNKYLIRIICITSLMGWWCNYSVAQPKKFNIIPDTTINLTYFNNLVCNAVIQLANKNWVTIGWGQDNTFDSNIVFNYTMIWDSLLNLKREYKVFKDTIKTLGFASNKCLTLLDNFIYEAGWNTWLINNGLSYRNQGYLSKKDTSGNLSDIKYWGDSSQYIEPVSIDVFGNELYLTGSIRHTNTYWGARNFYIAKADTNLIILWEKEYQSQQQPEWVTSQSINNKSIYICGYRYAPPFFDDVLKDHIIRKVDSAGNLISTVYLPYKANIWFPYLNVLDDGVNAPKLVTVNFESNIDSNDNISNAAFYDTRIRILDTNLQIVKTHIIHGSEPGGFLNNVINIGNGKLLLVGQRYIDMNNTDLGAWASVIDTSGHVYWNRTYEIRHDVLRSLNYGVALNNGGFLLSGSVGGEPGISTQDALLLVVDSMGCLDTTGCYPMGVHSLVKQTSQFKVFPNPTTGHFTIQTVKAMFESNYSLSVYELTGKLVQTSTLPKGKSEADFNIQNLANGFYLIKIQEGSKVLFQTKIHVYE